jgi:hypothetical protein
MDATDPSPPVYDLIGEGYVDQRRPDPRWDAAIRAAVGDARSVVNVGAGTGSYEPTDRTVIAVEPSTTMIGQRPASAAPAVRAAAEAVPVRDGAFDAALAILTVHHWADAVAGFAELRRIARRQVVLTWDERVTSTFWLVRDYLPEIAEHEAGLVTLDEVVAGLDVSEVVELPVPADCTDGALGAYWRRPHAYLDPAVRASMSGLSLLDQAVVDAAMDRLRSDLDDGSWHRANARLEGLDELDLGYRIVVAGG